MYQLVKIAALCVTVAATIIGSLLLAGVIPPARLGAVAGTTFGILGIIFAFAFVLKGLGVTSKVRDETDQRVP